MEMFHRALTEKQVFVFAIWTKLTVNVLSLENIFDFLLSIRLCVTSLPLRSSTPLPLRSSAPLPLRSSTGDVDITVTGDVANC